MSSANAVEPATPDRKQELKDALADIRSRVQQAAASSPSTSNPTLVAVSKIKPASDILACYELGQLDFGENYVQEMVDKASVLPVEIRWHFIGTLQSNKAKVLASIPNLYSIQTVTSIKAATALEKALPSERSSSPLNILIQVNTSGEDSKSGLDPLKSDDNDAIAKTEVAQLAKYIVSECTKLRLHGLMTIGSLESSLSSDDNPDFETLKATRDLLEGYLKRELGAGSEGGKWRWGRAADGRLELSMGMSSDFEAALRAGGDIVRVGTGIFGSRPPKPT
ncbi:hypothetical protein AX16_006297 [Volvariella volvacea WC 439]|nr:hypothetical protein AX16_006297 [Volvariella volvacea WC 439]